MWLARQGLVQPGAGAALHEIAKRARQNKEATGIALTNAKRPNTRWGDAVTIRDVESTGGWSGVTSPSSTRRAQDVVGGVRSTRLSHILLASESMAREVRERLGDADADFEAIAKSLSNCAATRDAGGAIGWVDAAESSSSETAFPTDGVLPASARREVMAAALKPGDVTVASSELGFHVVKVDDVLQKLSLLVRSRAAGSNKNEALLFGEDATERGWAGRTYRITTMGCQMNAADSERLEGSLRELGLVEASVSDTRPNVVVLNTCSIREHAERKVYSLIGPHAKRKREGQDVTIVVAGCVAQQEGERLLRRAPEVDVVMGPQYANRVGDVLDAARRGNQVVATEAAHISEDPTMPRRSSTVVAWVNVMYGCNERCTYCVVPSTRGVEQSREPAQILSELRSLGAQGYREATLLGQNVDAFGRDMLPKRSFHELLAAAAAVAREFDPPLRLRFATSHPKYLSERVVDVVAANPDVLMPVFHIPAQSGDDAQLDSMGRGYSVKRYLAVVARIRRELPDATITSDFIVGCPGESDEAFERTVQLCDTVRFDSCMSAAYSPRPGTPMARWDGASEAFQTLGVKLPANNGDKGTVTELRASVLEAFRVLAKLAHPDASSGHSSPGGLARLVAARDQAIAKLDEIDARPPGPFAPLSEVGPAQVSEEVKEARLIRLVEIVKTHALERARQKYPLGKTEEVLVEQRNTRRPTQVMGRTRGNKLVFFEADAEAYVGKLANVTITEVNPFSLVATLTPHHHDEGDHHQARDEKPILRRGV